MKVLQVNVDDLNYGGVYALIKEVVIRKPLSLQIDIFSIEGFQSKSNKKIFEDCGCKIVDIGNQSSKLRKQYNVFVKLFRHLRENKYDAIHIHADTANKLLVSGLAAKMSGSNNIVLHAHASGVEGNHRIAKKIIHLMCRPVLPYIGNKFVVCSDKAGKWMFPGEESVVIINNGIDLLKFKFDINVRKSIRKELDVYENQILIGHVGRFCYPKNHIFLIKIAKQLKKNGLNFKMIFIGDGETKSNIETMTKSESLENEILFYGTSDRVQDLLQAMDIFLLPSIYEGFPIVGVEAQASGLPVIFSDSLTRNAKLTKNVDFIGIEDSDIKSWCKRISDLSKKTRCDTYEILKMEKFDISDTVNSLIDLYSLEKEGILKK